LVEEKSEANGALRNFYHLNCDLEEIRGFIKAVQETESFIHLALEGER
jgi:hypothetical protein